MEFGLEKYTKAINKIELNAKINKFEAIILKENCNF